MISNEKPVIELDGEEIHVSVPKDNSLTLGCIKQGGEIVEDYIGCSDAINVSEMGLAPGEYSFEARRRVPATKNEDVKNFTTSVTFNIPHD